jgi:hypothetical protein
MHAKTCICTRIYTSTFTNIRSTHVNTHTQVAWKFGLTHPHPKPPPPQPPPTPHPRLPAVVVSFRTKEGKRNVWGYFYHYHGYSLHFGGKSVSVSVCVGGGEGGDSQHCGVESLSLSHILSLVRPPARSLARSLSSLSPLSLPHALPR